MLRQVNRHFGGIEKELEQKLKVRGIRKWKNGFVDILLHKIFSWQHLQSFDRAKRNFDKMLHLLGSPAAISLQVWT